MAGDPIYLELNGEQKEVRYTWKAIKRLRAEHDINLFGPDGDYEDPHTITAMLWAALVWDNDKLIRPCSVGSCRLPDPVSVYRYPRPTPPTTWR